MRTAIIGGGIAGLAAAYEFELARARGSAVAYTLFEAGERLGGVISSETVNGAVLERGPDSFLTEKPAAAELCRELGLGADLIASNDAGRKTWIVVDNSLVPLPDGLMFLVPTRLIPTAMSRLFSARTKMKMALDLFSRPRSNGEEDESIAALVERHYGHEVVDRLADPLLSGIYGGSASQLSARTVLPRLVEMESEHGSLSRGMLAARRKGRTAATPGSVSNGRPVAEPRGVFTSLRGGMQQLVTALEGRIDRDSVRLSTPVSAIDKSANGWVIRTAGDPERFDSVIVATPSWTAGALLAGMDRELGNELGAIPYSSSIIVNLIYDKAQLGPLPAGFGFLVPASEGRSMLACTFVHNKFLGRTPAGKAVLRAFLGGVKNEALLVQSDESLLRTVRHELGEILPNTGFADGAPPEHTEVTRWPRAMAQYAVGHQQRMQRIGDRAGALRGLRLAGNAYDGIGISDCVRLGRQAATDLISTVQPGKA